jgi:hypothetical protein
MHPIIRKAREHLDQQAIEHETWRAEHAAVEDARIDALLAKPAVKTRDYGDLIYRRNDAALMHQQTPQSTENEMPLDVQRQWNRWADERIRDAVEETAQVIGQEVGAIERGILAKYDAKFTELYAAVAQLRVELETLRAARKKKHAGT